jgi:hypothetical protein
VKLTALVSFCCLAYFYFQWNDYFDFGISCIGIGLFNPIYKLHFKKDTWQQIDIWVAIICGVWIIYDLIKISLILRNEKARSKEETS